jgi:hypothetical protein
MNMPHPESTHTHTHTHKHTNTQTKMQHTHTYVSFRKIAVFNFDCKQSLFFDLRRTQARTRTEIHTFRERQHA